MCDTKYRCQCRCFDSIQATTCLLTNVVRLAPVSNRVGTGSDEELLNVEMQHVRPVAITVMQLDLSSVGWDARSRHDLCSHSDDCCSCFDSIQDTTFRLTNEVEPAQLSNRVVVVADEELLLVDMQHVR